MNGVIFRGEGAVNVCDWLGRGAQGESVGLVPFLVIVRVILAHPNAEARFRATETGLEGAQLLQAVVVNRAACGLVANHVWGRVVHKQRLAVQREPARREVHLVRFMQAGGAQTLRVFQAQLLLLVREKSSFHLCRRRRSAHGAVCKLACTESACV